MEKERVCCFTGHRPEGLPWGENEQDPLCLGLIHAQHSAYHGCPRADWTWGYPAQGLVMPDTGYTEPDCARD